MKDGRNCQRKRNNTARPITFPLGALRWCCWRWIISNMKTLQLRAPTPVPFCNNTKAVAPSAKIHRRNQPRPQPEPQPSGKHVQPTRVALSSLPLAQPPEPYLQEWELPSDELQFINTLLSVMCVQHLKVAS